MDHARQRFLYIPFLVMAMFAAAPSGATAAPVECGKRTCDNWKSEGSNTMPRLQDTGVRAAFRP
jgi:hypothetical protein